jgi:hypothetical protein
MTTDHDAVLRLRMRFPGAVRNQTGIAVIYSLKLIESSAGNTFQFPLDGNSKTEK